jgi:hypothetical protein
MGWLPSFLKTDTNATIQTLITELNQLSAQGGYQDNNIQLINTRLSTLNHSAELNRWTSLQRSQLIDNLFISMAQVILTYNLNLINHREFYELMVKITEALGCWCYENKNKLGDPQPAIALDSAERFCSLINSDGNIPDASLTLIARTFYDVFQNSYLIAQTKTSAGIFGAFAVMLPMAVLGWDIICAGGLMAVVMGSAVLLVGLIVSRLMERVCVPDSSGLPRLNVTPAPLLGSYITTMNPVAPTLGNRVPVVAPTLGNQPQTEPSLLPTYWTGMTPRKLSEDPQDTLNGGSLHPK